MLKLFVYRDQGGREPFSDWMDRLKDRSAKTRIQMRLQQCQSGNLGDVRAIGEGVLEMRIHIGPGYRVYCALHGDKMIVLLCGGVKSTQKGDIRTAQSYWQDWRRRLK